MKGGRGEENGTCVEVLVGLFLVSCYGDFEMEFQGSEGGFEAEGGVLIGCAIAYVWIHFGRVEELHIRIAFMTEIPL